MIAKTLGVAMLLAALICGGCPGPEVGPAGLLPPPVVSAPAVKLSELIDAACVRLAQQLMADQSLAGKKVAVVPLADAEGGVRRLGVMMAEGVGRELLAAGVEMVDRQHLNRLFDEIDLARAVGGDSKALKEAEKVAGADVLIVGRMVSSGAEMLMSAKAMRVGGGRSGKDISSTDNVSLPVGRLGKLMWYVRRPASPGAGGGELPKLAILHDFVSPTPLGDIHVRDGDTVRTNQKFKISVQPNSDCYLYVLLYDSRGSASVLFPHGAIRQGNFAKGGVRHTIPAGDTWYWFDENPGVETFYIVASYEPLTQFTQLLAKLEKAPQGDQQIAAASRKRIDGVITRGLSPATAGEFSPKDYEITTRGVKIGDFSSSSPPRAAGSPDLAIGHATVVRKITLRHIK